MWLAGKQIQVYVRFYQRNYHNYIQLLASKTIQPLTETFGSKLNYVVNRNPLARRVFSARYLSFLPSLLSPDTGPESVTSSS
jgi:hypothetical protein